MTNAPTKPQTFHGDLAHLPAALVPLTRLRRWVIWKWETRKSKGKEKWTKTPYQPLYYNEHAKSNDESTWGTYEEALHAFSQGHCDGIGFMLLDSDLGAVDLDHIRDLISRKVLPWAEKLFAEAAAAGCYVEWTVSGTGARIIGIAKNDKLHCKINVDRNTDCSVEFYRHCERYITVSGLQICGEYPGLPIPDHLPNYDAFFDALYARFCDDTQKPKEGGSEFDDEVVGTLAAIEECDGVPEALDAPSMVDFNDVGLLQKGTVDYDRLIEDGTENEHDDRSVEFQRVVWHLAAQGKSAEEIAEELEKHPTGIGAKYAGRLLIEVQRSYGKWQQQRQTSATGGGAPAAPTGTPWPQIRVVAGEIPRVVAEAEAALLAYESRMYQRGGLVVRPVLTKFAVSNDREDQGWHLIPVTKPYLVDVLTCAAQFWRYNYRSKAWLRIDAPDKVADTYLARRGRWKLPVLSGLVHTPFLRRDGSICETPGYDAASGLMFMPEGEHFPPIPQRPSKKDAVAALAKLIELIKGFPFVQDKDRSVALSAVLTILDRRSMPTAPLHAFSSPVPGTGKSLLVDLCSILATGRLMPVISQGHSEEELEKRLGAALLAGDTAISLDNCDREIGGPFLAQALTQQHLNIRILGLSRNSETPNDATLFATGNNLAIAADATRRVLLSVMDACCERPETRTFNVNVIDIARQRRGELVVAALTVLRAYHVAKDPIKVTPLGSFEIWLKRICEPLVWLGQIDPCETMNDVRKSDPRRDELIAVLMQWELCVGVGQRHTVHEVIARAVKSPNFYTALMNVAMAQGGRTVSNALLGRWLKRVEGKIANGLKLVQDGISHGYPRWKLLRP